MDGNVESLQHSGLGYWPVQTMQVIMYIMIGVVVGRFLAFHQIARILPWPLDAFAEWGDAW